MINDISETGETEKVNLKRRKLNNDKIEKETSGN